jgi:hypothetical protein
MNRKLIAALSLLAMASTAAIADSGNGPRYRDLVRQNRDAREAAPPKQPEQRSPPVVQRDERSPRFARDDDRRHDGHRNDGKRHDDRRHDDRRWRDDDRRNDDRRWRDDDRRHDDRRWRNDDRRHDDRRWRDDDRRWHGQRDYRDARGRVWHYDPGWYQSWRHRHYRHHSGRYYARERFHVGVYIVPRSYVQRVWRSGDWLPRAYWHDAARYELRGWWRYGLYDPPYWATWVRVRDDAVLIDRGSGEVIDVVYDLFW